MDDLSLLVLAGHLLGDFVTQTDWQAVNKESSWRADLGHVLTYHFTMAVLVLPDMARLESGVVPGDFGGDARARRQEVAHEAGSPINRQQGLRHGVLGV
jgi:hypothetical protein